jgi:hypothetical protein
MEYLNALDPIFSKTEDIQLTTFLKNSFKSFYEELDNFCLKNDNYDFGEWFSETSFLSIYLNGLIRKDAKNDITVAQEFCVPEGRCDAQITFQKNIYLVESKMERYKRPINDKDFDIDLWIEYDESKVRKQLNYYFEIEEQYYTAFERYDCVYLMTLAFKMIKEDQEKHFENARTKLNPEHENNYRRFWFYSTAFLKDRIEGLEVYGTVEKKLTRDY